MHFEQRREARSTYTHQPRGKLQVFLNDAPIKSCTVKDVSPTGLRLEVNTLIPVGENILIRYVDEKVDLKLNGTVAWNSISANIPVNSAGPNAYLIGIRLTSPSLLQAFW